MNKTLRFVFYTCILLSLGAFVGCSDDDPVSAGETPEPALAGNIGVYADAAGTDTDVRDTGNPVTLYVVHKVDNGATASSFKVEAPSGWTRLSAAAQFPVAIGDVDTGISLGYGQCMKEAIHLVTLTYQTPGNTPAGAKFKISPHATGSGKIEVVDCSQNLLRDAIGEETPVIP